MFFVDGAEVFLCRQGYFEAENFVLPHPNTIMMVIVFQWLQLCLTLFSWVQIELVGKQEGPYKEVQLTCDYTISIMYLRMTFSGVSDRPCRPRYARGDGKHDGPDDKEVQLTCDYTIPIYVCI